MFHRPRTQLCWVGNAGGAQAYSVRDSGPPRLVTLLSPTSSCSRERIKATVVLSPGCNHVNKTIKASERSCHIVLGIVVPCAHELRRLMKVSAESFSASVSANWESHAVVSAKSTCLSAKSGRYVISSSVRRFSISAYYIYTEVTLILVTSFEHG